MSQTASKPRYPRIVVAGAGVIGCFVGGMLVRGAHTVTFFLRERLFDELSRQGLTISDFDDLDEDFSPDNFGMSLTPDCLEQADIILVTVKTGGTETMAKLIARHAPKDAVVISLQNGIENAASLRRLLPDFDVRAGVVPFAASYMGGGHFHRSSTGGIYIERGPGGIARKLSVTGLTVVSRRDITALQWGKLLMNLNNALNALSGLLLRDQIASLPWRKLLADQIVEALAAMKAEGITPRLPISLPLPPRVLPIILRLPTPLFRRVARTMLTIDPHARSSMWDDVERGKPTEIDILQGAIVAMADKHGLKAPVNARVATLISRVTEAGTASPSISPQRVRGK